MLAQRLFASLGMIGLLYVATPVCASTEYEAGLEAAHEFRYAEALQHFRKAAAAGDRNAMRTSGLMLLLGSRLYGQEIRSVPSEAIALLKAAADAGCEVSNLMLTRLGYYQGC